jgi:putative tryptophan/tyrosine transport system substrate-binding protein
MIATLKRREFITLLGGAAAAWPLAARAQQPERMRRVGVLMLYVEDDPQMETARRALRDLGYVEGRNLALEYRYAEGRPEHSCSTNSRPSDSRF